MRERKRCGEPKVSFAFSNDEERRESRKVSNFYAISNAQELVGCNEDRNHTWKDD